MAGLVRYPTSFLGSVCHTIAGLSVIGAVVWLFPATAYVAPSAVTGAGRAVGIDLTELVDAVQATSWLSLPTVVGVFVGFLAIYVAFSLVGDRLYAVGEPATGERSGDDSSTDRATSDGARVPAGRDYVESFSNVSLLVGGMVGLFFLILLTNPGVVPASLFGVGDGQFLQLLFGLSAVYLVAGYGARKESMEAVVVGTAVFAIRFVMGIAVLNTFSIIVGGLGVYYGAQSIRSGRLDWVVLASLGSSSQPAGGSQPQRGQSQPPQGVSQGQPSQTQSSQGQPVQGPGTPTAPAQNVQGPGQPVQRPGTPTAPDQNDSEGSGQHPDESSLETESTDVDATTSGATTDERTSGGDQPSPQ